MVRMRYLDEQLMSQRITCSYPAPELSLPGSPSISMNGYIWEDSSGTFYWDVNGEGWGGC